MENTIYTANWEIGECSEDAIDRFVKENGFKKIINTRVSGMCETVNYRKNGTDYFISSKNCTLNSDMSGTVEFKISK